MAVTPDQISDSEPLSHALFHPGDATTIPFWVKYKALIPPNKFPREVSFNRACYIPDSGQKKMAKEIPRAGKTFVGFVVLTSAKLQKAMELFKAQKTDNNLSVESFEAEFKYTPIFLKDEEAEWPAEIEKKWGNGHNPAHTDLFYEIPVVRFKPNTLHDIFAKLLCKNDYQLCEVYEDISENKESDEWGGEKLCKNGTF